MFCPTALFSSSSPHARVPVEFGAAWCLLRPHAAGDDIGPRITFRTNRLTRRAAQHRDLSDMPECIAERSLNEHLRGAGKAQGRLRSERGIEGGHVVEEATDFGIPIAASFSAPEVFACGQLLSPFHQV